MSQNATLYSISSENFKRLQDNLEIKPFEISDYYESFEKTFEGLRFVLQKMFSNSERELIEMIFYPKSFLGEPLDYDNIPDDFDFDSVFENSVVYYNDYNVVVQISKLLNSISELKLNENFNSKELNKNSIYPGGVWNDSTDENVGFNVKHIENEYQKLVAFFEKVSNDGNVVLSYVG